MKKFKQLQNVKVLNKNEQRDLKGGVGFPPPGFSCPHNRPYFCEPGICIRRGAHCP